MKKKHSSSSKNSTDYTRSKDAYDGNMEITNLRSGNKPEKSHSSATSPQNVDNYGG